MLNLDRCLVRLRRGVGAAGSGSRLSRVACFAVCTVELGVLGLSVLALATAGCAAPPQSPPEKPPSYFRSPTLDYQDPPRSASDGEVMGANKQSPDETLQASPTNEHLAPGWEIENGMLVASPEARKRGHGSHSHGEPGCEPAEKVKSPEPSTSSDPKAGEAKDPVRKALRPVCKEDADAEGH